MENQFMIKLQAALNKAKSILNIKKDIKDIEAKLPKLKILGTLDSKKTQKDIEKSLKTVKAQVIVDADTTKAKKKIDDLAKKKNKVKVETSIDNSDLGKGLNEAEKQTTSFFGKLSNNLAGLNVARVVFQQIAQAAKEAIANVKELNAAKTNIQMASGASNSEINGMMKSYNGLAKEISSTTKATAESANEFIRMGESAESTTTLIRNSEMLAKIGMIESGKAAEYLISAMKGYKISADDSISITDKLVSADMVAAISAKGLAEAMSKCANIADSSGTSMDRLIGYVATVGEVTQKSMSEVGNSFQSIYSRMNNIKINRWVDDESGESLSDTETVLDKLGIKLRDTENTYRDFDDVLDDIGNRWDKFTQVEKNAISVAIAGSRQRENFVALMSNYATALKISEVSANSAGTALERYGTYQDSIAAKTNELTTAFEALSTNTISEDLYKSILEATTGIVEFVDKTQLLKGTLAGMATFGAAKIFTSMTVGIIAAAKSTAQLTAAMALFNNGRSADNLTDIGKACIGLSNSQLKLVLSTKGLKNEQRYLILAGMELNETQIAEKLTTLGFAQAENTAATATFSFAGALNTLKAAWASNPIGLAIMAITTAVSIGTTMFSKYKRTQEETAESLNSSKAAYDSLTSEIESLKSELDSCEQKILEINKLDGAKFAKDGELEKLEAQHKQLEANLALVKESQYLAAKELANKAEEAFETPVVSEFKKQNAEDFDGYDRAMGGNVSPVVELEYAISEYKRLSNEFDEINQQIINKSAEIKMARANGLDTSWKERSLDLLKDQKSSVEHDMEEVRKRANEMSGIVGSVVDADKAILDLGYDLGDKQKENFTEAKDSIQEYTDFVNNIKISDLKDEESAQLDLLIKQYNDLKAARENASVALEGNVDLNHRPIRVNEDNSFSTVDSSTFNFTDFGINKKGAFNVTPILPNGETINNLEDYIYEKLDSGIELEDLDIFMGSFESLDEAEKRAQKIHDEHQKDYQEEANLLLRINDLDKQRLANQAEGSGISVFSTQDKDAEKVIDNYQKQFSALSAAMDKVKNKTLTGSELLDLQQEFPSLVDSAGDLSLALNNLVDDTLAQVIKYLNDSGAPEGLIDTFKGIADEAKRTSQSIISFTTIFSTLQTDKLEEYVALIKSGTIDEKSISSYSELSKIMQQTGISAKDAVSAMKEFSDGFTLSKDLISGIQDGYNLIESAKKNIKELKVISLDTLNSITAKYPQLQDEAAAYTQGLISTEDMMYALQTAYDADADNFRNAMASKLSGNETFFSTIKNNNQGLFDELANAYGLDVKNWKTMAQAKAEIDQALIRNLSSAWSKYYNIVFDSVSGLASLDGGPDLSHVGSHGTTAPQKVQEAWSAANAQKNKYNQIISALNEAANIEVEVPDFGGIGANKSGSGKDKKEKEPKSKDFDWITRRQELLQKLHDKEMENVNDEALSYQTRIALIDDLIAKDNERLDFNKKAEATYSDTWDKAQAKILEEAAKKNKDGHGIITSIMEGNVANDTFTDDLADAVEAGTDAFDNFTAMQEKSEEINKETIEHLKQQRDLKLAIAQAQIDIVSAEADSLSAEIKLMEATGKAVGKEQLKKQISLSDDLVDSYYDRISALEDEISALDNEDSAQYHSLMSEIYQCEAAIADCAVQQAEWNDQIKRLPIEKISRTLEMLGFVKEDLQNFIDQQNALGKATSLQQFQEMANINIKQLEELMKQQKLLSDLLGDYEFGSTKYQDTVSDLQDIDNEISSLIQNQYDWNKAILQLPIDQLSKAGDVLQNAVTAMSEILADYDSAISAVTGTLDKQIKAINDLKDATTDEYESKIKPLQDELDTLQKQNEARKIQLDLEKAQSDLDRANEQKTNKVVREGEMDYEADQDAVRAAQNTKNDAEYNKTVHDLETQISNLEEERDKLLEGYDDQIEKLDEIKDRWSSIVEEIKIAADALKANDILGAGWQDKILSGNDEEMLNSLKDLYTTISDQKNQYEEQIASNERIADMMNQFMESWQNGSITYDQAMAGIKDLANQMKDGYSSLEHLDAIMGLNGATDLGSLLDKMQNSANASVNQFEDYMKVVKANSDALSEYNSSWEEMQQNIKDQIAALEKLAEEASKIVSTINKHSSSSGGGSKGPNTNDKNFVNSGPGVALAKSSFNEKEIPKYHEGGFVEQDPVAEFIKSISAKKLETNEVPSILELGEYVLTPEQQRIVEANFCNLTMSAFQPPITNVVSSPVVQNRNTTPEVNITIKDMNLTGINDVKEFVHDFQQHIEPAFRQAYSKNIK